MVKKKIPSSEQLALGLWLWARLPYVNHWPWLPSPTRFPMTGWCITFLSKFVKNCKTCLVYGKVCNELMGITNQQK
jgi:hypothetical protein